MKKPIIRMLMQFSIAFVFTLGVSAQTYNVSSDMSKVKWKGAKVIAGGHEGTIDVIEGKVVFEDGKLISGILMIDVKSLACTDLDGKLKSKLENHLKSEDFFGVEKYPTAEFLITSSKMMKDDNIKIAGELTIKGKTKGVSFMTKFSKSKEMPSLSGQIEIDRTEYDIKYGSGKFFDNLGDKTIKDTFTLDFVLHLK